MLRRAQTSIHYGYVGAAQQGSSSEVHVGGRQRVRDVALMLISCLGLTLTGPARSRIAAGAQTEFLAIATCARLSRTDPTVGGDDAGAPHYWAFIPARSISGPGVAATAVARSLSFGPPPLR